MYFFLWFIFWIVLVSNFLDVVICSIIEMVNDKIHKRLWIDMQG